MSGKSKQVSSGEKFVGKVHQHAKTLSISIFVVLAALYLYPDLPKLGLLNALETVSQHDKLEKVHTIAIGWNTNLDSSVNALQFMKELGAPLTSSKKDHMTIKSNEELAQAFAFHFEKSSAVERHVADEKLFNKMVATAEKLQSHSFSVGGNAALMACQFAKEGHQVLLGGPIGSKLMPLLHNGVSVVVQENQKGKDEVHIILEYNKGEQWGDIKSSRANRFILTRDHSNSKLMGLEELDAKLQQETNLPKVFIASGINILEGNNKADRTKRLHEVVDVLRKLNQTVPIHLEFASIGDTAFAAEAISLLLSEIDSIGFNEQELDSLYISLGGEYDSKIKREDIFAEVPVPSTIAHAIQFILEKAHVSKNRRLSRVHFHSYAFHVIAERQEAGFWKNSKAAVAHGAVVAATSACQLNVTDFGESDIDIVAPLYFEVLTNYGLRPIELSSVNPVAEWKITSKPGSGEDLGFEIEFYMAPTPVCMNPKYTVGLGDAISAAGLLYSL